MFLCPVKWSRVYTILFDIRLLEKKSGIYIRPNPLFLTIFVLEINGYLYAFSTHVTVNFFILSSLFFLFSFERVVCFWIGMLILTKEQLKNAMKYKFIKKRNYIGQNDISNASVRQMTTKALF